MKPYIAPSVSAPPRLRILLALAVVVFLTTIGLRADDDRRIPLPGAVYTMSNEAAGNRILSFLRFPNGRLLPLGSTATGGNGTGGGLGNQEGLVISKNERWLLAVNAGSNSISVFEVRPFTLALRDVEPSGGIQPVSLALHGRIVYVLNAQSDAISGFRLTRHGQLVPIPGSTRALSASGTGPAQISFSPDGGTLVVTEKNTNNIVTFTVDDDGLDGQANVQASNGQTPFGFAFGKRDHLLVSEAFGGAPDASALSSYNVDDDSVLTTIAASVGTTETAACWVAVTPDGRFAYVTNTGSASVSGYAVDFDGTLQLLDTDGRTGVSGDGPIDLAITDNGRLLFTLNSVSNTISAFRINSDGSLTLLPVAPAVPSGANGLAVR